MKAKVIRDDLEISRPLTDGHEEQVTTKNIKRNGRMVDVEFWKLGAIIDHPDAWKLVSLGCAEAADEECAAMVNRTPAEQAAAAAAYARASAGILPKDFAAFNAGYMTGYAPDGKWIPGPNYAEYENQQKEAADGAA